MTKLAAALPKGQGNGLDELARDLIDRPHEVQVVVMLVDCKKIATDVDTGDVEPTARIRRIEVVAADDRPFVQKMMRRAFERRTGAVVLPFELEEDMQSAFGGFDPRTGEMRPEDDPPPASD